MGPEKGVVGGRLFAVADVITVATERGGGGDTAGGGAHEARQGRTGRRRHQHLVLRRYAPGSVHTKTTKNNNNSPNL